MFERLCGEGRIEVLYVPLQSGSQRLLIAMNRGYKLDTIVPSYERLRRTADTIFFCNWLVGFPGETDDDHEATRALISEMKQDDFKRRMARVDLARREYALSLIATAETIHVDDFASGADDVASTTLDAEITVS